MEESQIAIEVPSFETVELYTPPVKRVEGFTDGQLYRFATHDSAGSTLNIFSLRGEAALSSMQLHNNGLFWQLDASSPCRLNIYDFSLQRSVNKDESVCLEFSQPICPSIAGKTTPSGCHIYLFTANGMLHDIYTSPDPEQVVPLLQAISVQSRAFSEFLGPHGCPSSLSVVGDQLCIGTEDGRVLFCSLEGDALEEELECAELNPNSSLFTGWLLGGFLGRGTPLAVEQMVDLTFMGRPYLCTLHAGAVLRFWDLTSRLLIHSVNLLPSKALERVPARISVARIAKEPLDASRYILLICLQPLDSESPCQLRTFELYLEERGGDNLKLGVEGGALLSGTIHRIIDVQIRQWTTNQAAWLLHDDSHGNRYLSCVPFAFVDGEVSQDAVNVMLIEDQILSSQLGSEEELGNVQHIVDMLCSVSENSENRSYYVKGLASRVCAPGRFSRPILQQTLNQLGWDWPQELPSIKVRDALVETILSGASTPGSDTVLGTWSRFVGAYAKTFRQACHPIALVQQVTHHEEESLIVLRAGGHISLVRKAEPVEEIHRGMWPNSWNSLHVNDEIAGAKLLWKAARAVAEALGGPSQLMLSLVRDCIMNGTKYSAATILPRMFSILSGAGMGRTSLGVEKERKLRSLAITVGKLCSSGSKDGKSFNLKRALTTLLELLAQERIVLRRRRRRQSTMENFAHPLRALALATAHQIAAAQSEVALSLTLAATYIINAPMLGMYSTPDDERSEAANLLHRRAIVMLEAAVFAYWSTSSTIAHSLEVKELHNESSAANLVFSMRLRDVPEGTRTPPKHARLDDGRHNAAYPADHCFVSFVKEAHIVRDVGDASSLSWWFAYWLMGIRPSQGGEGVIIVEGGAPTSVALTHALHLAPQLLRTRSILVLRELLWEILNEVEQNDVRIVFYRGCAYALSGFSSGLTDDSHGHGQAATNVEVEALQCFARVSASFSHRQLFVTQLEAIGEGLDVLGTILANTSIGTLDPAAPDNVKGAAEEVYYYEVLVGFFEKLGFLDAATKCALAAIQKLPTAAGGRGQSRADLVARRSLLWSAIFSYKLAESRHEDAFVAILGIEDADVQSGCLRRLIKDMVVKGKVSSLCTLPYASDSRLSLLDETVSVLTDLAMSSSLSDRPQPYWVLFDFHVARGSYQSAAKTLMTYVRRLERESESRNANEIRSALNAALAALQLTKTENGSEQTCWMLLEVPMMGEADTMVDNDMEEASTVPRVVTVADLKRECALARARSALVSMLPAGRMPSISISSPSDVAHHLLALRLYDEAFAVVDAALVGNKQQQVREHCVEVLARQCAQTQLGFGSHVASGQGTHADDDPAVMEKEKEKKENSAQLYTRRRQSAARDAWLKLRYHLERYEGSNGGCRLRLVALDAVLATDCKLQPPPWLIEPFFCVASKDQQAVTGGRSGPSSSNPDVAGLLRVYMTYGRQEEAALMALRFLEHITNRVPSIAFPRPAATCVPHSVLRHLISTLDDGSPLRQELEGKLGLEESMATRQTSVLSEIYAE